MFDLRLECFRIIMDHACIGKDETNRFLSFFKSFDSTLIRTEVSRLHTQETWELEYDENVGSHTKLPNLFHDMVVNKASTIYEHVLSVNVTKGERKVSRLEGNVTIGNPRVFD